MNSLSSSSVTSILNSNNKSVLGKIIGDTSNLTIEDNLDHNNIVKKFKTNKNVTTIRLMKSLRPSSIKLYKGEVATKSRTGINTSIIYEDIENEKSKIPKNTESDELNKDDEYLKIDQSKFPLEIFDDLEMAELDKSPQEWLDLKCGGKSLFYQDGEFVWRDVDVLGYDAETRQYIIKFLPVGIQKKVNRLNIKFDLESNEIYHKRYSLAETARNNMKAIMRLDYFISRQSNDLIRPIQKEKIREIHEKVIEGLPSYIPFPEHGSYLGIVLRNLTADLIHWYIRVIKKTVVACKVMNPVFRDEVVISRFRQLKLPMFPEKPAVPFSTMVECPTYPLKDRVQRLEHLHYCNIYEVLQVLRWMFDSWESKFQKIYFFDSVMEEVTLPCKLELFRKVQIQAIESAVKKLQIDVRRACMNKFTDEVQDIFDFFQSNTKSFKNSTFSKVQRSLNFILAEMLRKTFEGSLYMLYQYVLNYTGVVTTAISPRNENSDTTIKVSDVTFETIGWRNEIQPQARLTEFQLPLYVSHQPLIQARIIVNENEATIEIEPSMEEIQHVFNSLIDKMVSNTRHFNSIEKDLMTLLPNLETRPLLNIGAGDPQYVDIDSSIRFIKKEILTRIASAYDHPLVICKLFSEFLWLLEEDPDETLASFLSSHSEITIDENGNTISKRKDIPHEDYFQKLSLLSKTKQSLSNLCFSSEVFGLIHVSCAEVKLQFIERCDALLQAFSELLTSVIKEKSVFLLEQYNSILDRISVKPKNEYELAELRKFIETSTKITIIDLKAEVQQNHQLLRMMEYFNLNLSYETIADNYSLLEYPVRIEISGREVEIALESNKIKMIDRLILEKDNFDRYIEVTLTNELNVVKLLDDYNNREKIVETVNRLMDSITANIEKGNDFNMREQVFNFLPSDYTILATMKNDILIFYQLWNMISDFYNSKNDWLNGDIMLLDGRLIEENINDWWKSSYKLSKLLEEKYPGPSKCALSLRNDIAVFRQQLPVIQCLASKALQARHWESLSELLGKDIDPRDDLTLQQLLDLDVSSHIESIQEITMKAEKEYNLEKSLLAMKREWESMDFEVKPYRESGTFVVGGIDDIVTLLDDHIVKTQTMRGSPYVIPIEKICKEWEYNLKYAQSVLDSLLTCQKTWMYLQPIFSSDDIMRQLPTEARKFNRVDTLWRKIMQDCSIDSNFLSQCDPDKRLDEQFKKANQTLDEITKGLNDYLETKRLYFPRFFFLSNDELLEILSQTKEPRAVQAHLSKCFEGINRVTFDDSNGIKITEMISGEGEIVKMDRVVDPESAANKGNVEKWLLEIESIQWESIRSLTAASIGNYLALSRGDWILNNWPAQVIIGVSCLYWTSDVTTALKSGGSLNLRECNTKLDAQLRDMVELVRGQLSKLTRMTLGALTTIDVHNRDVVSKMVELGVQKIDDFEWISQLRYYWEDSWKDGQGIKKGMKTLVARIVNARCLYGYEYLGNSSRLVITNLTDRCYRTMVGAIDLLYGGAPEGPAGTGKTETVKDLSKAMAMHCVVFNCSDQLDYQAMGKFFKGLAGCGSWCCFDEFNRIDIEVLSVIAQQILVISQAKREGKEMFHFEGTYMKINSNCNVFITMNPGYAGRAELPDNLKALFRPCAMMVPDYALIGEIRLYSFGFENARENAQKIVRVLQLSSEQLSSQKHYDYGMRAVNSILIACGNLRQQLGNNPLWDEAKIVLRSINDVNLAKFLVEDLPLFRGITSDLFPGVVLPEADYDILRSAIIETAEAGIEISSAGNIVTGKKMVLECKNEYITKTIQLYEMVLVRHGVMVVGQTGSGKTASIHNLAKAMAKANTLHPDQFENVLIYTINPKAVTSGQLYGQFDPNTQEFTDGIVAKLFRECAQDPSSDRKWILFDGPVDAVWIENMNTVLDDNKKLCLVSGEIIRMSNSMTMFFEAEDLESASPATVSRVGMIFCEVKNIGWKVVRNVWLKSLNSLTTSDDTISSESKPVLQQQYFSFVSNLFDWLFPVLTYFVTKYCQSPTKSVGQELIFSLLRIFRSLLDFDEGVGSESNMNKILEGCFLYSLVWSVGSCISSEGRNKFDTFLRSYLSGRCSDSSEFQDFLIKNPDYTHDSDRITIIPYPELGYVYDYYFDAKTVKWVSWLDNLSSNNYRIPADAKFNNILIPTIDTIRNEWLIEKLLIKGHHVLCTGDTGTGKSVSIKHKLLHGMPSNYFSIFINFSAKSTANQTQTLIDSKLDKRRKGVLGPPLGMKVIVFVDDLNMPEKEVYGAQPPIEILRQWMDHQGWYDLKSIEYRRLVDIQFCNAMGPVGGGRSQITKRYIRHFNVINFINFSNESLTRVFTAIVEWKLSQGFTSAIKSLSSSIVNATIGIYNTVLTSLLPTPLKSHYTFNLRDVSKVFQGILQGCHTSTVKEKESLIRLWSHECLRIFHDRLVDLNDRIWFNDQVSKSVQEYFQLDYQKVKPSSNNLIYGNFANPKLLQENRVYCEISDFDSLSKVMIDYLEDYNQMQVSKQMNLVLFSSAIEHIARISRIINQPNGNALLVGVGGSGRKSLTTLAVHIAEFELFQIEITKSYSIIDWREDIKNIMNKTGVQNKSLVFLLDDTQIVNETFLEDINGILNTGEVASLYTTDELNILVDSLSKSYQDSLSSSTLNAPATPAEIYNFFITRVRENLHVVLTFSPIGEAFRTRLRKFPSLVNCCTISWFTEWEDSALKSVAQHFLSSVDLDETVKSGCIDVCVDMQQRVVHLSKKYFNEMGRYYYVTPTSYLELINTFKSLLEVQRKEILDSKSRYDNGLSKLLETEKSVAEMQVYLEDLKPKLNEATIETDLLLVNISKDRQAANEQSIIVEAETAKCNQQADEAKILKDSCENDLAAAIPALQAAENALKNIKKSDIVEMKSMAKPPEAIKMTMAAVCIMLGHKPDKSVKGGNEYDAYWVTSTKEVLSDVKFLNRLLEFDRDNIDPQRITKVSIYTNDSKNFNAENIAKRGSVGAAGIASWVLAMVVYDKIAKEIAPKRAALKQAEATLKIAQENLSEKQATLKEVTDKLNVLEIQLNEAEEKKSLLNNQVNDCEAKLRRADALIKGLGGEKTRWTEMSANLSTKYKNVTGDILLSSGAIAYLGAFTSSYREEAIQQWSQLLRSKSITCSNGFTLRETLGNNVEIRKWIINRLPNDSFSIENAIMLKKSNRWPLMIDPQGQANKWIKKMEEGNGLKVVKQSQGNFIRTLENAIQFGNPVLIENVQESLDPILEPLLLKQFVKVGGVTSIRLGDNTIEYDNNFRLYITSKLRNPHYKPEIIVKINLLNFMATSEGLEDQMLGKVVAIEQKELESQRQALIVEDSNNQKQLKEIEDKILFLLQNAQGNILDDEVLIDTLADSKRTSNIITEKVKIAEQTQIRIAKIRQGYTPIASLSSSLFFMITDLCLIDPMYQYSLDWYINLFEISIETAEKSKVLEERLQHLNNCFTYLLYKNICRSLFEKDKLLFSFLLTTRIMMGQKRLGALEFRYLLQGASSLSKGVNSRVANPHSIWLQDKIWEEFNLLCANNMLPNEILDHIQRHPELWKAVIESNNPIPLLHEMLKPIEAIPSSNSSILSSKMTPEAITASAWLNSMNEFSKLLILKCARPDAIIPGIQDFIATIMGSKYIEPPQVNILECYNDSKSYTPIILVLTPGAAPMTELYKLAEDLGYSSKLQAISLGQGQGHIAELALSNAAEKGTWVCLQNCHLSISWMPALEQKCEEFSEETLHPNFRLFLTSEPSPSFPAFVLQNGVKMTNEPPKSMRANLLGSYSQIDEGWFESSINKAIFKKMLFGLCFFHATVRERKKFGPLGWNIQYVFSPSDLRISMDQLKIFLDDVPSSSSNTLASVPFAALSYLVGECNYGGRVTDDKDRRCIMNILDDFYTPKILDDTYVFSSSGIYHVPIINSTVDSIEGGSMESYKEYIKSLPYNEGPEVFGFHENANISCALGETNLLLETALSLESFSTSQALTKAENNSNTQPKTYNELLDDLAKDIEAKIPTLFDIEKALIMFPVLYEESMNTVLTQELLRFNQLLQVIKISLRDIQRAVKGQVLMSDELEKMGKAMMLGKVPEMWQRVAYPSLKPLNPWVIDLLNRIKFLQDWITAGQCPNVFWISGFFFTQAFITGTLQNFARRHAIPIDKAEFDFRILTKEEMLIADNEKPIDGAYISGLFMEGARWNTQLHIIDESMPRELYIAMPYIHLLPNERTMVPIVKGIPEQYTGSTFGTANVYMCPVYKTSLRQGVLSTTGHSTNYVMSIRIPMLAKSSQKHWIKRGVALLTQLDS